MVDLAWASLISSISAVVDRIEGVHLSFVAMVAREDFFRFDLLRRVEMMQLRWLGSWLGRSAGLVLLVFDVEKIWSLRSPGLCPGRRPFNGNGAILLGGPLLRSKKQPTGLLQHEGCSGDWCSLAGHHRQEDARSPELIGKKVLAQGLPGTALLFCLFFGAFV